MIAIRTVVCPVDFSPATSRQVDLASDVCRAFGARLILHHNVSDLSVGAVYATLVRLEAKGFIKSSAGEPTAERGGRAKRYFRVTGDGKVALRNTQDMIQKMSAGIKGLGAT